MKSTKTLLATLTLSAGLFAATAANATLISALGGQVVNDTDLNITWLSNANLAATKTFGVSGIFFDGRMTWSTAKAWIAGMNAYNGGIGYLGYNDWRLPTTTDTGAPGLQWSNNGTDGGYNNPSTSELSHLYYDEFGNKGYRNTAGVAQSGYGLFDDLANPNDETLFTNLQIGFIWSGTEYATNSAWTFYMTEGYQNAYFKDEWLSVMAVRDGQVATVPAPAAAWLLGSGLLGLIGVARRKAA